MLQVRARSHDPNHTKAFVAQFQVLYLLVHVAGCVPCGNRNSSSYLFTKFKLKLIVLLA
jgi:hypothetical protein